MGKTVHITAVGQGMGRDSVIACSSLGGKIIATDINAESLSALSKGRPEISAVPIDVCGCQAYSVDAGVTI